MEDLTNNTLGRPIHKYNKILDKNIVDEEKNIFTQNKKINNNRLNYIRKQLNNIEECNFFYKDCIKNEQIEIIKHSNKFLNMMHNKDTLKVGYKLVNNIKEILYYNRLFTELLKNISDTCDNYINEIESDIYNKKTDDNFIYNTTNGMVSYDERSIYLPDDEDDEDEFILDYNKYKQIIKKERNNLNNINQTNTLNQTNQNNQNNQNNQTNQTNQNNQNNQTNQTNQTIQTNQTNQTIQNNQTNQTIQNNQTNKISNYEINNKIKNINNMTSKTKIFIKEIGYDIKIDKVNCLTEIKPMFYWFDGDENYDAGIYCSPYFNTYIKVPFPKIIDINKDFNKSSTVCCKFITKEECNKQKNKYDNKYDNNKYDNKYDNNKYDNNKYDNKYDNNKYDNNKYDNNKYDNNKSCNFVHKGDDITKIGITARCSKIPDFGNPSSLNDDLYDINLQDMKSIMLYGINDSFLMTVWLDYNIKYKKISKHNMLVLDNLDKFI
jgi:hypothetical protein